MFLVPLTPRSALTSRCKVAFGDANPRHVHRKSKSTICCPDGVAESWKQRGLLREPASHFPAMRHFAVDHSVQKKSEVLACLDWPNRPLLQLAWSGMMNRVSSLSAPLLTLGHHVKERTNQASVLFPFPLLSICNNQIHKDLLKTDASTPTHVSVPTKHKHNQANFFFHLQAQKNSACAHMLTSTHFCNPLYDAIAVRCFTAVPTAGIPHW